MDIKAADVKALREQTGAGMMECKKALVECNGNAAEAAKLLKEKGLAAVEKRAGRATSEGRIFIKVDGNRVALAELNCETDFVAKNEDFLKVGEAVVAEVLKNSYTDVNETLSNMLLDLSTKIRENMSIKRISLETFPESALISSYIHSDGKTGSVVAFDCDPATAKNDESLKEFAYDCCLHIVAFNPTYTKRDDVDEAYIKEISEIFTSQVAELDKPEKVKAGIIQGKITKHLADVCFMEQAFVKDDKLSVAKKAEEVAKKVNAKLSLIKIISYQLGA